MLSVILVLVKLVCHLLIYLIFSSWLVVLSKIVLYVDARISGLHFLVSFRMIF